MVPILTKGFRSETYRK